MSRCLDDWLQGFLDFMDNTEPPFLYKFWCGVSTIAAALQRKCYVPWGTLTFYPNMYIVLIGPPGRTRKGTAIGPAMDLLQELDIPLAAEATTREALIRSMFDARDTSVNPETGESYTHSSLTIFSAELTVFLGYQNHQLMSDLADWYDCRTKWTYRTKTQGSDDIRGVWVNILGATTPELIRTTLPMDAIGGGLTSRIIFVNEDQKGKIVPAPFLSPEQEGLRRDLLYDLEQIFMMSGPFRVTNEFLERWCEWYTYQEHNPPFKDQFFDGYMSRRANHIMKLSTIISAARRETRQIELEDFEDALRVLEQTELKMTRTFQGVGHSPMASVVTNIMTTVGNAGEMTKPELLRQHHRDVRDEREMDAIINMLESSGFCKRTVVDGVMTIKHNSNYDGVVKELLKDEEVYHGKK